MFIKKLSLTVLIVCAGLFAMAQSESPVIDVQHYTFKIQLNDEDNSIKGEAAVAVKFLSNTTALKLNLMAKNSAGRGMTVLAVTEGKQRLRFSQDSTVLSIHTAAKAQTVRTYTIRYAGIPADGLIIATNKYGKRTFFGDNWPNRARHWLPCNDHPSDKAPVDFYVTAPDHYQVVANGKLIKEQPLSGKRKLSHWQEAIALPTKVIVIGVADFAAEQSGTVKGIPVYSYVYPQNKAQGFKDYALANQILPFYMQHIGAFPFEKLANVQSKTIFGGMENASAIFYYENSVGDKGIESLIAHEVAHQWFGDGITETGWQHVWLSEGFATYMTNTYLENTYGTDSLQHLMQQQRKKIFAFEKRRVTPVIDSTVTSNYMQILNANSYEKGAWVLHMLRRKIGDEAFWRGIRSYYAKYNGRNAATADFVRVMEQTSSQQLGLFFDQWLRRAGHPHLKAAWKYDEEKKILQISVDQEQAQCYDLVLQYQVGSAMYSLPVKQRTTIVQLPLALKPMQVIFDPSSNLLAEIDLVR